MKIISDIVYNPDHGERGKGDLYLPDDLNENTQLVLIIHGGGWTTLDKSRMAGIGAFLAREGFASFSCNYRLAGDFPWPAGANDCLDAAKFLWERRIPELQIVKSADIGILGGSAGGHYALMTGLRFAHTKWIVSISGVADLEPYFTNEWRRKSLFGHLPGPEELREASPQSYLDREAIPPILCTHMKGDPVVDISSMQNFAAAAERKGISIRQYVYEFRPDLIGHGIWRDGTAGPLLLEELEQEILKFIRDNR